MKTILSVVKEYLTNNKYNESSFEDIFNYVEKELSVQWAKQHDKDFDEIVDIKRGEVYKLLTIDGSFIRNEDGTFSLKK